MFTRKNRLEDCPTVRAEDMFEKQPDRLQRSEAQRERAQQQREERARTVGWNK
jgi:hypothetical protein